MKKWISLLALSFALLLCLAACNNSKYNQARKLIKKGEYEAAYALLEQMGDDEKAAELKSHFYYVPVSYRDGATGSGADWEYNEDNLPFKYIMIYPQGRKVIEEYTYNDKGNIIQCTHMTEDGKTTLTQVYTYDKKDNMIKCVFTTASGISRVEEYEYDRDGNKTKMTVTADESKKPEIYEYAYDVRGNVIREVTITSHDEKTSYDYIFDDSDRLIRKTKTYPRGDKESDEYTYDEHGNKVREVHTSCIGKQSVLEWFYTYDEGGHVLTSQSKSETGYGSLWEYTYDARGNQIKAVQHAPNGIWTYERIYDDQGNLIKSINTTPFDETTINEYAYDAHGNKVREVTTDPNGKITTREYAYDAGGNEIRAVGSYSEGGRLDRTNEYKLVYIPYDASELSEKTKEMFADRFKLEIKEKKK